jgi:uncharacterized protein
MNTLDSELYAVLSQFNPWWSGTEIPGLPTWRRVAFQEVQSWVLTPPTHRAVLLSGARQTGKTTLLQQMIQSLLDSGIAADRILYATFDHPLLKLAGIEKLMDAWQQAYPPSGKTEFLFLDEIQYVSDWQTWLKLEVDFRKQRRIVVTGSAIPLSMEEPESGVGRWHTIKLPTLSFYEYLRIKDITLPKTLPLVQSLRDLFAWKSADFVRAADAARSLVPHFHEYLLRGGFPQTARIDSIPLAQRLLREDIVDKVLKRDMTAYFGVRRILELERTFL